MVGLYPEVNLCKYAGALALIILSTQDLQILHVNKF